MDGVRSGWCDVKFQNNYIIILIQGLQICLVVLPTVPVWGICCFLWPTQSSALTADIMFPGSGACVYIATQYYSIWCFVFCFNLFPSSPKAVTLSIGGSICGDSHAFASDTAPVCWPFNRFGVNSTIFESKPSWVSSTLLKSRPYFCISILSGDWVYITIIITYHFKIVVGILVCPSRILFPHIMCAKVCKR